MTASATRTRLAIVTGGAGGIGAGICRSLAEDGLRIAVADRKAEDARRIVGSLEGRGHDGFSVDVSSEESVIALFDAVEAGLASVDVLVACAGAHLLRSDGTRAPVSEMSLEVWETTHAVNSRGTFLCCREFARRFQQGSTGGRIVTISSISGQIGGIRASAAYTSSKGAVASFTKALARELAPAGVTVNSVAPGLIDAPMLQRLSSPTGEDPAANVPAGRLGTPADVASAVSFLVSPGGGYLTGATIDVNGGLRMS